MKYKHLKTHFWRSNKIWTPRICLNLKTTWRFICNIFRQACHKWEIWKFLWNLRRQCKHKPVKLKSYQLLDWSLKNQIQSSQVTDNNYNQSYLFVLFVGVNTKYWWSTYANVNLVLEFQVAQNTLKFRHMFWIYI